VNEINESFVKMLFNELKESNKESSDSMKDLTIAITDILRVFGNNPDKIVDKLESIKTEIDKANNSLANANYRFNLIIGVFGTITVAIQIYSAFFK